MLAVSEAGLDLSPIRIEHGQLFQAATEQCQVKSHHYYFPRLLFGGKREKRILVFEQVGSSIVLYSLYRRSSGLELRLYVPPFPFETAALQRARDRMRDFNRGRASIIEWVQEGDADLIASHGFSVSLKEREFIYDRAAVAELSGSRFSRLRNHLARAARHPDLVAREFAPEDAAGCLALYRTFCSQLSAKDVEPKGARSMTNCLKHATRIPTALMRGEVIEVEGVIRGYAFGGPMSQSHGCVFVVVSDHEFPGLSYALRHRMMTSFPHLTHFNDSTDNGRVGLREMKERFRPVEMHGAYRATELG
jgi:hypothetical protein